MSRSTCSLTIVSFECNTNDANDNRPSSKAVIEDLINKQLVVLKTEKDFDIESYIKEETAIHPLTLQSKLDSEHAR